MPADRTGYSVLLAAITQEHRDADTTPGDKCGNCHAREEAVDAAR